jgi:hypothetical protein
MPGFILAESAAILLQSCRHSTNVTPGIPPNPPSPKQNLQSDAHEGGCILDIN